MPAVERKTEHVKILQDLGYDPWEIENDDDMLRALKEAINDLSRENPSDGRIPLLQAAVKGLRRPKFKEKKTTIKGDKFMGKEPKKDAPITDKSKLLPGAGFEPKDAAPEPPEAEQGGDDSKKDDIIAFLNGEVKDKLDEINTSVGEIKDVVGAQGDLAEERDEDMRQAILAANKKKREKDLEKKKGIKDKMLESVTKPVGNFLNKLLKFVMMTFVGSAVNRLLTLLKDPAQFLDPIKKLFNFIIGMVNAVVKGLWNITGAPINFIIGGINSGVKGLLDALSNATGLLKNLDVPQIPSVPGPPQFNFIPLSKTAQAENEAVGMAGGGVVPGYEGGGGPGFDGGGASSLGSFSVSGMPMFGGGHYGGQAINRQEFTESNTDEHGVTTTKSGVRYLSPEEQKEQWDRLGMPALQLTDGSYVPNFGKMAADDFMKGIQMVRENIQHQPDKIKELDNFMATNPYAQPDELQRVVNRLVPGSYEHAAGEESDAINAATQKFKPKAFSGGGIVPAPYPVGDNILGLSPSFSGLPGYNKGGKVPGKGEGDTVPAMLTPGEFVMSKGAVDQIGADKLKEMNAAGGGTNVPKLMKFAGGGIVPGIDAPNKKGGKVVVIGGGGGSSAPRGGGSSDSSGEDTPKFSSTDPNNINVTVIKSIYNLMN